MSKTTNTKHTFRYSPQNKLTKTPQIKKVWDLSGHYYKNEHDARIENDALTAERTVHGFVKKYQKKDFTKNTKALKQALTDYENLYAGPEAARVIRYFSFRTILNVNDSVADKKLNLYGERFRKLANEMVFFKLAIGKIPKKQQTAYLKDTSLSHFHYFLKTVFESAKHHLSEAEERILTLRSSTSSGMWADAVEKVLSNRTITYKKQVYHIPEALEQLDLLPSTEKGTFWNLILDEMVQLGEFAEHELTAIVTHDKVSDELRKYEKPYSATVLGYENDEKAVEALIEAISSEGFKLSKRFYKLKSKLHSGKKIPYANKYDSIGDLPQPTYEESVEVCRDVFYGVDEQFGSIFDRMLKNGQIDAYPKAGKRGGAFCTGELGHPTYVMLNHTPSMKALETLAHEMGHAIHTELSKTESPLYQEYSTVTAETASTLFEHLVLDRLVETLDEEGKRVLLHDKIAREIATVQRQIAFFNFEREMHETIRTEGALTNAELAKLMQKHLQTYLGPGVDVTEKDGYSYVYVPHVRYGFYVYSYSYGYLMSNLMAQRLRENNGFVEEIQKFLHSGGNDTVENIFKSVGINARKVETFTKSLQTMESDITRLEKLMKKS